MSEDRLNDPQIGALYSSRCVAKLCRSTCRVTRLGTAAFFVAMCRARRTANGRTVPLLLRLWNSHGGAGRSALQYSRRSWRRAADRGTRRSLSFFAWRTRIVPHAASMS